MKLNMKNSIYQSGSPGLSVQGGRLINNLPSSEMGIVKAANARKEMKRDKKIQMQAEAYLRGEQMAEIDKSMRMNGGSCCD
jgi:hypothetical protein